MKYSIIVAILAILFSSSEARTFSRCELVRELRRHGFPEHQLADWVCLVERESSMRTHVVGPPNTDGSKDYGLFQINNRYWCVDADFYSENVCNVPCAELLSNDITKAANCAKIIFQHHGFEAWYGWRDYCKGQPLPDINSCSPSQCPLCQAMQ